MIVPLALVTITFAIFAIRLTGLPDLVDNEFRLGATVLNAIQGGNWILPHDSFGNTDKPPMLTWLSALTSLLYGRVDRFTLYFPTAIATATIALLVFGVVRRFFGRQAGLFAGLAYLLSDVAAQQVATARWDGLFALTTTLVALAAFRAWTSGGGWTVFWLAGAAATLTKGPLGICLGALGLLAVPWERSSGSPQPLRGSHAVGLVLLILIAGGWFLAAYRVAGQHLVDDMIRSELVRHAVMKAPGHRFRKPPSDFVANFAPWSLLTTFGLWRIWSSPADDAMARRFERFCACWFGGGLLLFAVSPHNPARLLYPLMPPAAIIAGRELDRIVGPLRPSALAIVCTTATAIALTIFVVKYHHLDRRREHVRRTLAIMGVHDAVHDQVGDDFPITYTRDVSFALQLTFNTMRPSVTTKQAAALLRDDAPAYVVTGNLGHLQRAMGGDASRLHEIAGAAVGDTPYLHLVGNRPRLAPADDLAVGLGPVRLRLTGLRLGRTQDGWIELERGTTDARVSVQNTATDRTTVVLRLRGVGEARDVERSLAPGERWVVTGDGTDVHGIAAATDVRP